MKKITVIFWIITASIVLADAAAFSYMDSGTRHKENAGKKYLVVYYSKTGNTREVAHQIHQLAGGDIFEIQAVKAYPDDYEELKKVARKELDSEFKPALKTKIKDIRSYDQIFIGYPIWWGTFPAPVRTFLSENDLSGKTLIPFCTHLGSHLGRSVSDISALCPQASLLEGLGIHGRDVKNAQKEISAWLRKIDIIK